MKLVIAVLLSLSTTAFANERMDGQEVLHYKKGHVRSAPKTNSPLLQYRGGTVLQTTNTMAIFWGSQWSSATFDSDKIIGMDHFFSGFSGSRYAHTSTEYADSFNGYITPNSAYIGHVLDLSAAPAKALTTTSAVVEVCKITNNNPLSNGV